MYAIGVSACEKDPEVSVFLKEVYLDNSATTKVCDEAAKKVLELMVEKYGNPSSLHQKGFEAEQEIQKARAALANALSCEEREIIFTSGGTEANNLAIFGAAAALRRRGGRIVTTAIEHSSVLESCRQLEKEGFEVVYLTPRGDGTVSEEQLRNAVTADTILVSVMKINNETGAILPVECIKRIVTAKKAPALVHVDAVQAFGKLSVKPQRMGADLLTLSAHKIHGPKGVGALYLQKNARILPRAFGGEQERKLRPGTESAALIAGFGAAVEALPDLAAEYEEIRALNTYLREKLRGLDGVVINSDENALPYLLNFSVPGVRSETMLHHLAADRVFVSSGSACAKGRQSHVLAAMGLEPKRVVSAIRVSFGRYNTKDDVDALLSSLQTGINSLARARS